MSNEARTIPQSDIPAAVAAMRANFDEGRAQVRFIVGAEDGANTRRVTIIVTDRLRNSWGRNWIVRVWLSDTVHGGPAASGSMSVATGSLVATLAAGKVFDVATVGAVLAVDVTVTGAATKYVNAAVIGEAGASALTFA